VKHEANDALVGGAAVLGYLVMDRLRLLDRPPRLRHQIHMLLTPLGDLGVLSLDGLPSLSYLRSAMERPGAVVKGFRKLGTWSKRGPNESSLGPGATERVTTDSIKVTSMSQKPAPVRISLTTVAAITAAS